MKGILRFFALPLILLAFGISLNGCGGGSSSTLLPVAPGSPSNVSATPGDSKAIVDWNAVIGASSYNIYYATTPGVTKSTGTKIEKATKPYEITGLTNGTTYYFVVTAVNAFGESSESSEVSATPIPIPAKPKGSSAYSGDNEAVVYCQPVDSATSYNLYYSTTTGVTTTSYTGKITGMTNPQTVTGLLNGTTYFFVITAVNAAGEGPISSEAIATPSATQPQPPPSPSGVLVTAGIASITVDWFTCYTATTYNIYYAASGSITTAELLAQGPGVTVVPVPAVPFGVDVTQSYTVIGLTPGTTYSFVVTAENPPAAESAAQSSPKKTTSL
jgi:hypothetical protein